MRRAAGGRAGWRVGRTARRVALVCTALHCGARRPLHSNEEIDTQLIGRLIDCTPLLIHVVLTYCTVPVLPLLEHIALHIELDSQLFALSFSSINSTPLHNSTPLKLVLCSAVINFAVSEFCLPLCRLWPAEAARVPEALLNTSFANADTAGELRNR